MESQDPERVVRLVRSLKVRPYVLKDLIDEQVFHCVLSDGQKRKGFGSAESSRVAMLKAISELVERDYFRSFWSKEGVRTSSGFAAHHDPEVARKNAELEIVERDAFLCSWIAKKPPYWLSKSEIDSVIPGSFAKRLIAFSSFGFDLRFGLISKTDSYYVLVGKVSSKPGSQSNFGFAIDTVADNSLLSAITRVYQSLCYIVSYAVRRIQINQPFYSEVKGSIESVDEHISFYLDPKNEQPWFDDSSTNIPIESEALVESKVLHKCEVTSLYVARATSKDLQPYFVGKTTLEKVNVARLQHLFPNHNSFFLQYHPLG